MSDSKIVPGMCPQCRRTFLFATDDGTGWCCGGCGWNHVENSFTGPIDPTPAQVASDLATQIAMDHARAASGDELTEPTATMNPGQLAELLGEATVDSGNGDAWLGDVRDLAEELTRLPRRLGKIDIGLARVFGRVALAQYIDGLPAERRAVVGDEEALLVALTAAFTAGMQAGVIGFGGAESRRTVAARVARSNPRALVFAGLVRVLRIESTGPVLALEMQEGIGEGVQIAANRDPELGGTLELLLQLVRAGIKRGVEEFVERTGALLVQPGSGSGVPS